MTLTVSRFSVFEEENRIGIQMNARILLDGQPITNVQVADSVRGTVKQLVLGEDGRPMLDPFRREARTTDLKGKVTIEIIDPMVYVNAQRQRLDLIESEHKQGRG